MPVVFAAICLIAGAATALAHTSGRSRLAGTLKMTAATAYIIFALLLGADATLYGRLVLTALAFCWLGDLLLLGAGRWFLAGLGAFLLAHVAYAAGFLVRGVAWLPAGLGAVVMVGVGVSLMRWLLDAELPGEYRRPVVAYVVAIGVMVALALGTAWQNLTVGGLAAVTGRAIVLGAAAFAASDILVARQRFVREQGWNRLVGLPLYFAAQLLLASSV